ncbi:MAG: hypothetical protein ACR2OX_01275 [Methyloligellaceae bacterium]
MTIWLSPDKIDSWRAPKRTGRGGELVYSDNAIEAMLTLSAVIPSSVAPDPWFHQEPVRPA